MSKITVKEFSTNLDKFRVPLSSFEREKRKGLIPYYGAAKIIDYVDGFTHTGLSVLIAEDGSVETKNGYPVVQLANGEYWVNNHTHVLKSGDDIDTTYLYYALQTIKVAPFVTGAVQKKISQQALNSMEIPYFEDKTDRKRIVEILSSFDEKIQLNTQINQTLEQIAQALFKSWFVDFDPVRAKVQALSNGMSLEQVELAAMQAISGKTPEELTALSQTQPEHYAELAETAKAFPCEMVEIDGVEVPKGWEVKRIDEVIQKIPVGKKYSSKTAFSEGLVPILDQGRSGVIGYHNDKPGVKASIEDPIIVFANHTCYMRLISYDFSAIQNVFAFKGKECNLYWLYLATLGKQEFVEYKGHFPDFLIKEIIVPPEELTELFGKYIKENFSKIFINDRENSNLAKIRDLLLPKLLNGDI
ncbi:TPA: restriction endonuclease subunit S [Haemophilus influenzae]|uniref:restriction endonuclease subunit S n=1 Tax=Haemophilus influenzae TaxID=727 RepID=UPI000766ABB8|nr:restriction endonuclease subunit S [Haemophilus influenzae]ORJ41947.1 restriction endonuclease subunit S [Haemophilus influenzae]RFO50005.1 restriction endonuclease subunit S [Haemophilus influenzae]CWX26340.1 type i restriction enzyme [Haemophilus influenzae]CWX50266.1 type i restriction enzyme [Haemophilus influenzae]